MKNILIAITFLLAYSGFSQDSTKVEVETPKIVSKLMYGQTAKVEDLSFKFVAIESDSRCPKGVQCVWAGEVIALIDVFKNGKKLEQKRMVFSAASRLQNKIGNLFSTEAYKISALNVEPYPEFRNKIKAEEYYIQLDIRE